MHRAYDLACRPHMALHGPEYQTMPSGGNSVLVLVLVPGPTCGWAHPRDGVVRVEGPLAFPGLQLRLLAGQPGPSQRVASAHASEHGDPAPWLFGSEMVMTTGIAVPY